MTGGAHTDRQDKRIILIRQRDRRHRTKGDRTMKKTEKPADRKTRQDEFKKETEVYESTLIDKVVC